MNLFIWIPFFIFAAVCLTFVFLGGYLQGYKDGSKDSVKNIIKFSEMMSKLGEAKKENEQKSN